MIILGISAFYHDSAATLLIDGDIVAAAQEERFTRKKHDASFPQHAIRFCLDYAGITVDQVNAVVFYDKPLLKFERLLETYYAYAPKGIMSFAMSMPVWIKEKMFLKRQIWNALGSIGHLDRKKIKLLFPEHHLSHAASAFYPSGLETSAILTLDGVGEWATASICKGEGNQITILKQLEFPHSIGLLYSAVTYYCGFKVNSGEYKLMGLAPYGDPDSSQVKEFISIIKRELVDIKNDGSIFLHQRYFSYATGLRMVPHKKWEALFGFPKRKSESPLLPHHSNLAQAIQQVTEEVILKLAVEAKKLTGCDSICLAGGVALNSVANGKLENAQIFRKVFITPAAGDAGGAMGAALAAHHIYYGAARTIDESGRDNLKGAYLGTEFSKKQISAVMRKYSANYLEIDDEDQLLNQVASIIADGSIIGWHQGRMEFGPRALGARSILADARSPEMQKKLNLKIKYRESFRPFAPIVKEEDVSEYFEHEGASPYMLLVKKVKKSRINPYPKNYKVDHLLDKLYFQRSDLPSITHIDYSARLQTVHQDTNPRLWKLLNIYKKITGYSVLVNTSFNVRGEPIVNSPEDAYRCFMRTEMDYLIIGNFILDKKNQPQWVEKEDWKKEFVLD